MAFTKINPKPLKLNLEKSKISTEAIARVVDCCTDFGHSWTSLRRMMNQRLSFLQELIYWDREQVTVVSIQDENQIQGLTAVAVSCTETINACWRGRKTFQSFRTRKAASMNQEPNIDHGLHAQDWVSFGQRLTSGDNFND